MIEVFVNGKIFQLKSTTTVEQLLKEMNVQIKAGLAVAVNEEVLPKSLWKQHLIKPLDKVIIIKATAGG